MGNFEPVLFFVAHTLDQHPQKKLNKQKDYNKQAHLLQQSYFMIQSSDHLEYQ